MKDTNIIIRIPTELRASFKEYAAKSGTTMSDLVREFMESKVRMDA